MDHNHNTDAPTSIVLVLTTFLLGLIGTFISQIDIYLGVITKLVSLLSFALFVFINWPKIKERFYEVLNYLKK